jgi:ribosomal protein S18 acetylase RimI-like enzyme
MPEALSIGAMTRGDLDTAIEWAAAEGWNPGLFDGDAFHAADPEGFLIAMAGEQPVAVISAVRYGRDFGFVGFYIVRPDMRGRGYGLAIWRQAMARLAGRCIGLDGVVAQQDNYRRSGFALAHRNVRYQGEGGAARPAHDDRLKPLAALPFAEIAAYDLAFFPAGREAFLRRWIALPRATALGLVDSGGRLAGYGVLRPCRAGFKIGPLFADTADGAEALYCGLTVVIGPGEPVFLDVPECNPAAIGLARRHGMTVVFETARMYAGAPPAMALDRTFGITTFELG